MVETARKLSIKILQRARKDLRDAEESLDHDLYNPAVVAADRGVEKILREAVNQIGGRESELEGYPELMSAIEGRGYRIPGKEVIWDLRKLRNEITHGGTSASRCQAERMIATFRRFLNDVGAEGIRAAKIEKPVSRRRATGRKVTRLKPSKPSGEPRLTKRRHRVAGEGPPVLETIGITLACLGLLALIFLPLTGLLNEASFFTTLGASLTGWLLRLAGRWSRRQ